MQTIVGLFRDIYETEITAQMLSFGKNFANCCSKCFSLISQKKIREIRPIFSHVQEKLIRICKILKDLLERKAKIGGMFWFSNKPKIE